jgi:hypothetical protein
MKKGDKVNVYLHGAGEITVTSAKVKKIDKNGGVWIERENDIDLIGPFYDGKMEGVFGFWKEIKEALDDPKS